MGLFKWGKHSTQEKTALENSKENMREFDLNIEKILESWEVYHAVREIIANALDEQVLTDTKDIEIYKVGDIWHIRDYGRGLNYHHLTQNENEEKINSDKLIGRFGVGLKDALATLYRHNINVTITSKHGVIALTQSSKVGFDDIITLHAMISPPTNFSMVGTDVALVGCSDVDINIAKSLFLKFSNAVILETTKYGQIIRSQSSTANIYINGVKVAEEPNFLFSYNITSLNKQLKKALNRERTNVGRTAYTDRIKSILLASNEEEVIQTIVADMREFGSGTRHDELNWNDVALHASQKMSKLNINTTFITTEDLSQNPAIIDEMRRDGRAPVVVPTSLLTKMEDYNKGAADGEVLTTAKEFVQQKQDSYTMEIIDPSSLSSSEQSIYYRTDSILELIGGKPTQVKEIVIVKELYQSAFYKVNGLWDPSIGRISIRRSQLSSLEFYAGTLLHECAHAISGEKDVSRGFEMQLTTMIGKLANKALREDESFLTKKIRI